MLGDLNLLSKAWAPNNQEHEDAECEDGHNQNPAGLDLAVNASVGVLVLLNGVISCVASHSTASLAHSLLEAETSVSWVASNA